MSARKLPAPPSGDSARSLRFPASALCCLLLASCSGGGGDELSRATATADAALEGGSVQLDGEAEDAGLPTLDSEVPVEDAGLPTLDGEVPLEDAALPSDLPDAAQPGPDAAAVVPGATPPHPYLTSADSPFAGVQFSWFHLEDFEDHSLNTPGLSSSGQLSSSFGPSVIDSVDEDDGIPDDNRCIKVEGTCDAWWGPGTLTMRFDAELLGALPTHAGAVWTDGAGQVSFEAFGADGQSLYKIGPFSEPGFPDDTINSSTAEDRFFGVYEPNGISAITISNTAGGVEVDHVQYGRAR